MRLGLGTGSTAIWAARRVAERLPRDLRGIRAVVTSLQTELEARALGIPVLTLNDASLDAPWTSSSTAPTRWTPRAT